MHDDDADIAATVDRIVAAVGVPRRRARADLRRELHAHFEDAGASPDERRDALRRFGPEAAVIAGLRRVYAFEYRLLYAGKVAASVAASLVTALAIEWIVNLRIEPRPVAFALAVVVTVIAAWELARPPAAAVRDALTRTRLFVIFATFAAVEFAVHAAIGVHFATARLVLAATVLTLIASATLTIVARADRAFASLVGAA
jgi:hypothetical protein